MRVWLLGILLAGLLQGGEAPLFTDQEWEAAQRGRAPAAAPGWGALASLGLGVLAVVGLALGLGWAAKRLGARRLLAGGGTRLEVLETMTLAPRRQLALVRVDGHTVLIGIGERELTPPLLLPGAAPPAAAPFAQELQRLLPAAGTAPGSGP